MALGGDTLPSKLPEKTNVNLSRHYSIRVLLSGFTCHLDEASTNFCGGKLNKKEG